MANTYLWSCNSGGGGQRCLASQDSGLEALSRNPAAGSFAVLAFQVTSFCQLAERSVPLALTSITAAVSSSTES